jgi:hypothetical protein
VPAERECSTYLRPVLTSPVAKWNQIEDLTSINRRDRTLAYTLSVLRSCETGLSAQELCPLLRFVIAAIVSA